MNDGGERDVVDDNRASGCESVGGVSASTCASKSASGMLATRTACFAPESACYSAG